MDRNGVPDLRTFHESADHYRALHGQALRDGDFSKRVLAIWGLTARGEEAVPHLTAMLREPVAREDAAGALAWLGTDRPDVVAGLISAVEHATSHEERDAAIGALGALRSGAAVPTLSAIVRDPSADGDTRHEAAIALGQVVGRRFDRQPEPLAAALDWLDRAEERG